MVRLWTLGTLDLRNSDGSELRPVLTQPRRLALLIYLALATPRGFHRRDTLLALFWSDRTTDRARASLSRAIYFLRQHLGPGILVSRGDEEIGLDPDRFWCDGVAFEQELQSRHLREGLGGYSGELLTGFFAPDARGFEEWLEHERSRFRDLASAAAWELTGQEEQAGNIDDAVRWARHGVELAPFSEVTLHRLLTLLDRSGDRAGATRAYQAFADRMAGELDLAPSPETEALITAIRVREQPNRTARPVERELPPRAPDGSLPAPSQPGAHGNGPRRRGPLFLAALAAAAVLVAAFARLLWSPGDSNRVYVAPFSFDAADRVLAGEGRIAADRIIQRLATTGLVDVGADRPGKRRARISVEGTVYRENGRGRIEARIQDLRHRRIVWTVTSGLMGADTAHAELEALSRRVAGGVVSLVMPRFASWFPVSSSPPSLDAFLEFARGDELQARGADRDAVPHLEQAISLDPEFLWAELQLAAAHLSLFDNSRADPLIELLNRKRDRLNLLQRHWLDWMGALISEDLPGGYDAISSAARLAPRRFLYDQARWATFLNRPRETIRLLEQLGPENPYNGGTAGYWRLLTRSYHALEDFDGELAAAREARRYPVAPIVVLSFEAIALAGLGKLDAVRALLDTALTLPIDRGTSPRQLMAESGTSAGQLMVLVAEELRAHGHEAAAAATLARARAWYQAQPPAAGPDRARRFDLGMAAYYARDWAGAGRVFRSLVAEDPDNFVYLGRLGTVAARLGDEVTARQIIERFNGFRATLAMPHTSVGYWQSKITMLLGDEGRAISLMSEAVGPQGRGGMHADFDFERIWGARLFRDFVRPKG